MDRDRNTPSVDLCRRNRIDDADRWGSNGEPVWSSPAPRGQKQQAAPDLACTYYDEKTVGHAGTCGYDKKDKKKYLCYLNSDMAQSQTQTGCEWRLRRAEESKK